MSKENLKPTASSSKMFPAHQGEKATFAFGKDNYRMLLIGIVIVAIGMICMISSASDDPKKMSETIFDFQRLTLAPILIIAGYVVVLFAILKNPKE
ncbi:MAG: DUF3098 domain-containing protein [Bacteroidetes bacterium]|nr:DUF3098 domain-containing protein [Bacteroidota bacterium]